MEITANELGRLVRDAKSVLSPLCRAITEVSGNFGGPAYYVFPECSSEIDGTWARVEVSVTLSTGSGILPEGRKVAFDCVGARLGTDDEITRRSVDEAVEKVVQQLVVSFKRGGLAEVRAALQTEENRRKECSTEEEVRHGREGQ